MSTRKPISFRLRTALFIAAAFTLVLSAYFLVSYLSIERTLSMRIDEEVGNALDSVLAGLQRDDTPASFDRLAGEHSTTGEATIAVKVVHSDRSIELHPAHGPRRIAALLDSQRFLPSRLPETLRLGSRSIRVVGRSDDHRMVLGAFDTLPLQEVEEAMVSQFLILLASGLLVSLLLGVLTADLALKPLQLLIRSAMAMTSSESSDETLPTTTRTSEINKLASIINDVLAERNRHIAALRTFTADAAHELRTPLTILKGEFEVDLRTKSLAPDTRAAIVSNLEEVNRLIRIVEDLLYLARLEQDPHLSHDDSEPWRLEELLDECAHRISVIADKKHVRLTFEHDTSTIVTIPREDIRTIASNILANAVAYTPEHGTVTIEVLHPDQSVSSVIIRDTGIGIAAEDIPHLFDRFWRADRARRRSIGGTGLGLTIAKSLADRYGVAIGVESKEGHGTSVTLRIPLSGNRQ